MLPFNKYLVIAVISLILLNLVQYQVGKNYWNKSIQYKALLDVQNAAVLNYQKIQEQTEIALQESSERADANRKKLIEEFNREKLEVPKKCEDAISYAGSQGVILNAGY